MIDLSYLTEEEQEMILAVLKRDTELKKLEEQRTRQLYKTEKDRSRLKYLTGEWFYETKYHRHREKIHGSDIIRASMRQRKPVTILELSQRWDERPSFLNSQKKDVFIPPELSGIIEEPSTQSQNERVEHQMPEGQQERQRPQIKPRLNPFNIVCSQRETSRISNSVNEANQTPAEEPLPSNESYTPLHSILNTDNTDTHIATQCADKPVPKKRLLLFSCQNSLLDFASSDTTVKQAMTPSPRGILKHSSSSCSYIESLRLHIPNNNDSNSSQSSAPVSPISPPLSPCSEHSASSWLDRKQVRFSSIIRAKEREQGENSVLDEDCSALSDQDRELDRSDIVKNDRHELYAEPQSSQVSNFHCSAAVKGDSEEASPVRTALEHANARPLSISKSLEDLASPPSLSAVTTNTKTSFSDPEQVKIMSMSVPAFMQQEMDWRNGERSFHYDTLRACNTPSNFSMCSEVASMSSVTGSILSICSSEFGSVEVKGTIQFTIHYSQKLGEFHIFIVQCKDLAVADPKRKRSDPYVKCYLLPDKAKYGKRKTCVRKKTQNPTYNEILRFKIPMESLKTQKLNLSVWHNDTFGRNSFLGEAEIDLVEWDFNNMQMNEYQLKGRVQVPSSPKHSAGGEEMRAEMRIALRFLPQTSHSHKNKANGEVQIWVKECKNLPISRGVSIDPFVKCAVLPDNSRKSQQKTRVLKRASNPVFNHTMVYDGFRPEDLKEACVELTVWDHDRFNHFIGGVRLGPGTGKSYGADVDWMDSNSAEAALWDRMMQSQNEWVEDILPLRMLVMARMSR
ncbi:synaptotagmin-like protein 2 isoform X3 [Myxocyprinus asiaticus]|uniref:synaptotagmin-like protein 2 isoform X3 n=1 Tax=Myxocyprinus asiaticus TaxID=70543 RepID=UPI0022220737|nr:synaptotagmin-like protein 2 isoform X3 [Myxocyprinus asiaticus]